MIRGLHPYRYFVQEMLHPVPRTIPWTMIGFTPRCQYYVQEVQYMLRPSADMLIKSKLGFPKGHPVVCQTHTRGHGTPSNTNTYKNALSLPSTPEATKPLD